MASKGDIFSGNATAWIFSVGIIAFIVAMIIGVFGEFDPKSHRNDTFSLSAIGHKALLELLRSLETPVIVSQHSSAQKADSGALLIIAEPILNNDDQIALFEELTRAPRSLVVLPKWFGPRHSDKPHWVGSINMVKARGAESILESLGVDGQVVSPGHVSQWQTGFVGVKPELDDPQLVETDDLSPIIATSSGGILLGRVKDRSDDIWVLTDPDLLSNQGIVKGENAWIMMTVIDRFRNTMPVVVDETIHGFIRQPNLWRSLLELPLVVTTLTSLAALIALLWAATGRFGGAHRAPPALEAGKKELIKNTAELLQYGGYGHEVLRRYAGAVTRDVANRLHVPKDLDSAGQAEWLTRVGALHGTTDRLTRLRHEVDTILAAEGDKDRRIVNLAKRLHRWKREIVDGPANNSND